MKTELAEKMKCSHTAIEEDLHMMGELQKCGASAPCALSDNNKNKRVTCFAGLHAHHYSTDGYKQRFLYRIGTGDKKWCLHININQRMGWLRPGKQATIEKIFIHIKQCCSYGGTGKGLSITNCLNKTKRSKQKSMFNRWNDSRRLFKRKGIIGSMEFLCCTTTPILISPI